MSLTDHYTVLSVQPESSKLKMFKRFKKAFTKADSIDDKERILAAYLVLSASSKKYYDILLAQSKSNAELNQKYLNIILSQESIAKRLIDDRQHTALKKQLDYFPLAAIILDELGLFFGTDLKWVSLGITIVMVSIGLTIYGILSLLILPIIGGILAFIIGYAMFSQGVWQYKLDHFDNWLEKYHIVRST